MRMCPPPQGQLVAPPRGERGLKFACDALCIPAPRVAPPRGERGLKSIYYYYTKREKNVAPPRGERGLKCDETADIEKPNSSLPLVGSVD